MQIVQNILNQMGKQSSFWAWKAQSCFALRWKKKGKGSLVIHRALQTLVDRSSGDHPCHPPAWSRAVTSAGWVQLQFCVAELWKPARTEILQLLSAASSTAAFALPSCSVATAFCHLPLPIIWLPHLYQFLYGISRWLLDQPFTS